MKKRIFKMIVLGIKQMSDPYYQGFAAQMAFYMVLAMVPVIIVLSQILGLFNISMSFFNKYIDHYVSADVSGILKQLFSYKPAAANNLVMIVTALWAASKAQLPMLRISNYTYTAGKYTSKGFFRERARSVFCMIGIIFTVTFTMVVLVYGKALLSLSLGRIDLGGYVDTLWTYLRWPLTIVLFFLMISINYYILPSEKIKFREIVPGSVLCSIGMLAVTIGYSAYTGYVANYDIIYGSLASIVAMLFWLFFLAEILCLGVIFNKVWADSQSLVKG